MTWSCTNVSLQIFEGNNDRNSEVRHSLYKVLARYLRFLPRTHHGQRCMRTEVFGVKIKPGDGMIKNIITCSVWCVIVGHACREVRVWTQIVSLWYFKVTSNLCGATFAKFSYFFSTKDVDCSVTFSWQMDWSRVSISNTFNFRFHVWPKTWLLHYCFLGKLKFGYCEYMY